MTRKKGLEWAPYDSKGNLLGYADEFMKNLDWRENKPFGQRFSIETYTRGQSSAKFVLTDPEGREYPMFLSSALLMMQKLTIQSGQVYHDQWIVVKKGRNYGLEPLV